MALEDAIFSRTTGLVPDIGQRCHPTVLPEGETLPAVRFRIVSKPDVATAHDDAGPAGLDRPRVQFDVYAKTATEAGEIADALEAGWENFKGEVEGISIRRAVKANRFDTRNEVLKAYQQTLDFFIWYSGA